MPMADNWIDRAKRRIAEAQYERIAVASAEDLRPGPTAASGLALGISLLILSVPPAIAALGVWLMIWTGFAIIATVLGIVLVLMGWALLPPVNRLGAEPLGRDELPGFFALMDTLADSMDAPRPDGIVLDPSFNAFIGRFGRQRRRIVGIGLPLWQILEPEERVTLLAHELAHEINGDPARSAIFWGAQHSLTTWIEMLVPQGRFIDLAWTEDGRNMGLSLTQQLMEFAAWLISLALRGLWLLQMRESQRAEFYADVLAAQTAGAGAKHALLEKLMLRPVVESLAVPPPGRPPGAGRAWMVDIKATLARTPDDQLAQCRARMTTEYASVDVSHPPTLYRLRFLQRHAGLTGTFRAESIDWVAIETELDPFLEPLGQALLADPDIL